MVRTTEGSAQRHNQEDSMPELYYIGLDVHKKTISYCIKTKDGTIVARGTIEATRAALTAWAGVILALDVRLVGRLPGCGGSVLSRAFAGALNVANELLGDFLGDVGSGAAVFRSAALLRC
jgi:hypothetical protein